VAGLVIVYRGECVTGLSERLWRFAVGVSVIARSVVRLRRSSSASAADRIPAPIAPKSLPARSPADSRAQSIFRLQQETTNVTITALQPLAATFDRTTGSAECAGITVRVARGKDWLTKLCRALVAARVPDSALIASDQRGMACLRLGSIHHGARRRIAEHDRDGLHWERWRDNAYSGPAVASPDGVIAPAGIPSCPRTPPVRRLAPL